jgi:hypothetical protein
LTAHHSQENAPGDRRAAAQLQAVYRRHDYPAIAAELGIEVSEVERLIAHSIVLIDRQLRRLHP